MSDKKQERRGLGRGLSALMADVGVAEQGKSDDKPARRIDHFIPVDRIEPNPEQPRRAFPQERLSELAASIREKGVIQPLILRKNPRDPEMFEIVAGERRWRAAQLAQLHEVPAVVRELDDIEVLEIAIIENIQRSDLNPVEEAAGYRQLMDRFGHTQEKLAEALGKSRSHIANLLRLLNLPDDVLALLRDGALSTGHARALVATDDPSALAKIVVSKGLSVRQTEALAKNPKPDATPKPRKEKAEKDADTRALEQDLSAAVGMSVVINHDAGMESGALSVTYKSLEELDELCRMLSNPG
ncbi:ParB/RepB/Spo0J family partition protein [Oceaniglobus ichthyenteri]|uniref:ParB/RepB/Spo0J family partition protein n=1 Tax=Oceaniglobus ichthyenteri TaxID=2136177 RepID=UPI000D39385D|nr:ParB/RepB/Spo0J family partition protein [Oceaniglobus ichthyenteri]